MESTELTVTLMGAVGSLFAMLVTVTKLLLKEKDSKVEMLREFYEMTKEAGNNE